MLSTFLIKEEDKEMFADNAVGRGSFILILLSAIMAYGYLLASLFWLLPVKFFGSEPVILFYEIFGSIVVALVLLDLFVLGPIRDKDAKEHRQERLEKLRRWGRQ